MLVVRRVLLHDARLAQQELKSICASGTAAVIAPIAQAKTTRPGRPVPGHLFPLTADPAQGREVGRPFCILLAAEFVKIIPAVEAGVVSVVENDARRVIAHWLDGSNFDASFAGHGLFLGRGMALYFGAGGFHAKIFGRERKALAAVEADRQY